MRIIKLLLAFVIVSCGPGQKSDSAEKTENTPGSSILKMLPKGQHDVDVMDQVTMPARTQELMQKFQAAAQKNPEWFLEAQQKVQETGKPLPYDERIGMTEEEYEEFMGLMQNNNGMEMVKSSTETVTISHLDNRITFHGTGKLEVLDDLVIDLTSFSASIGAYNLADVDTVNVTDEHNGLRSRWKGYEWRFETSNKEMEDLKTIEDYQTLNMQICKVIVATLEKTKQTYMHVQMSEIDNGQKTIDLQVPLIFK